MNFKYPGRKQVDYEKGGFFSVLMGDQKIKVLKNLEKINNSVFVFDTTELKSFAFNESDADFQGKMKISDNKLLFEIKIPIQVNKYFESYKSLNEESLFCLKPGNLREQIFGYTMQMNNNPNERKENINGKQRGIDKSKPPNLQYWFSIKADTYE